MKRIPQSKKIRKELEELLRGGVREGNMLSKVIEKGMQIIMQEMLEAEVTEFLCRGHYERRGDSSPLLS